MSNSATEPKQRKVVNLTPHDITVVVDDEGENIVFPKSGFTMRMKSAPQAAVDVDGMAGIKVVDAQRFEAIEWPDADNFERGTHILVSMPVGEHFRAHGGNGDLWVLGPDMGPASAVRDGNNIVGCRRLALYAPPETASTETASTETAPTPTPAPASAKKRDHSEYSATTEDLSQDAVRTEEPASPEKKPRTAAVREEDDGTCIICRDRHPDTLVMPCMCQIVCRECSKKLKFTSNHNVCCGCRRKIDYILIDEEQIHVRD